jgi:hypothetical protein
VRLHFNRVIGILLSIFGLGIIFYGIAAISAGQPRWHPTGVRSEGLIAMEMAQNRQTQNLIDSITTRAGSNTTVQTEPPVIPNAPRPGETRLYNNPLDNLLSSLHYYYRVPESEAPSKFVVAWDPHTGDRVLGDAWLLALESNLSYLISLEIYKKLRSKAVFDEDLKFARDRVDSAFIETWHTNPEWPLGTYFDLMQLYDITGEEKYLKWADQFANGNGADDPLTPLNKAKSLAIKFQFGAARQASPIFFLHAALLADWGKRHDPAMINQARFLFSGLKSMLFDPRNNMLWKQSTVATDGSSQRNLIQTFNTIEQFTAIRAILAYGKASGDPESISFAKLLMQGTWGASSPMQVKAPENMPPNTFYGLYTGMDIDREAERMRPEEETIAQVLLFETNVLLNQATSGEFRNDVDFLVNWMETSGPIYREYENGYYTFYKDFWQDPENPMISSKAAIWMSKGLAEDEYYKFQTAKAIIGQAEKPAP